VSLRRRVLAACPVLLALLAGCASLPPPAASPGEPISGRLALQIAAHADEPARHYGSTFELHGDAGAGTLTLTTPLGTTIARAHWRPGEVALVTTEGERHHPDLDAMTRAVFGESLPLAALFDWLRARPWPQAPSEAVAGGFSQLGWHVDIARHAEGWVLLQRPQPPVVTLRVRLEPTL